MKLHPALAMPVEVVFAFFGKKLDGPFKARFIDHCPPYRVILQGGVEEVRLPSQFGGGVGVGVGNKDVGIEGGKGAIHGWVRGKPGFERVDVRREIGEALFDQVKSGLGTEKGEPWCPDVSRDEEGPITHAQDDLEKVSGIQAQDGTAVGAEVADPAETVIEPVNRVEVGQEDQVVDFPRFPFPLVNAADLAGENEPGWCPAGRREAFFNPFLEIRSESVQAAFRFHQFIPKLGDPSGVFGVSCSFLRALIPVNYSNS